MPMQESGTISIAEMKLVSLYATKHLGTRTHKLVDHTTAINEHMFYIYILIQITTHYIVHSCSCNLMTFFSEGGTESMWAVTEAQTEA